MKKQLSGDVLEEILSRLSVKDLLRFKSVSKQWFSIISSPFFIHLHLKKSVSKPRRIFIPYPHTYKTIEEDGVVHVAEELSRPKETIGMCLVGACDGLFCYLDYSAKRICIWNPALRVSRIGVVRVSRIGDDVNIDNWLYDDHVVLLFWFGRGSSDDDDDQYKLILGIRLSEYGCKNEICTNSIRLIRLHAVEDDYVSTQEIEFDDDEKLDLMKNEGVLLHGVVHWVAKRVSSNTSVVLSYDLRRWTVGEVAAPVGMDCYGTIGAMDGCLCAIMPAGDDYFGGIFEVWIMKEYGSKESWTKSMMIISDGCDRMSQLFLVGDSDDGDLILNGNPGCQVLMSNVAGNKAKTLVSDGYGSPRMYIETLLSP